MFSIYTYMCICVCVWPLNEHVNKSLSRSMQIHHLPIIMVGNEPCKIQTRNGREFSILPHTLIISPANNKQFILIGTHTHRERDMKFRIRLQLKQQEPHAAAVRIHYTIYESLSI